MVDLTRTLAAAALAISATIAPATAETSFLEAALFFITGLDATSEDTVSEDEIRVGRYPLVAYLTGNCAVRIRNTKAPNWVYQWDFCKFTGYQRSSSPGGWSIIWRGRKDTLCIYKDWGKNVNYDGPIDDENSTCNPLGGGGPDPYSYIAWNSDFGVDIFFGQAGRRSSVDRQMGAYKYIESLLTGRPYWALMGVHLILTRDEARRIATNIAKLPERLRQKDGSA